MHLLQRHLPRFFSTTNASVEKPVSPRMKTDRITSTYRMPQVASCYGTNNYFNRLRKDVRAAASADGYDLSQFNFDLIYFKKVGNTIKEMTLSEDQPCYSHSIVAGGLLEMSKHTRLTPLTSLMMRFEIFSSKGYGNLTQSAVIPSCDSTIRKATV